MSAPRSQNLLPGSTFRLLTHFLLHPERKLHFRALREHTGLGTGSLQRELARLEGLGLIRRMDRGGKAYYAPVLEHPSWGAFRTLVREHGDPADVLREALSEVEGIKAAFIFGSSVRGTARRDSDIDVFILEEDVPLASLGRATLEAQGLLERPLDVKRYTPATLARKLRKGGGFLKDALSGPKTWVIGSEDALQVA
jgi:predicted nucleotidyltransferase